jgi:hypothetical protein
LSSLTPRAPPGPRGRPLAGSDNCFVRRLARKRATPARLCGSDCLLLSGRSSDLVKQNCLTRRQFSTAEYPWDALPPSTGLSASPKMSAGRNLATVTRFWSLCISISERPPEPLVFRRKARCCIASRPQRLRRAHWRAVWTKHVTLTLREPGAWGEPGLSITHHSFPARQPALLHSAAPPALDGRSTPLAEPEEGNWRLFLNPALKL